MGFAVSYVHSSLLVCRYCKVSEHCLRDLLVLYTTELGSDCVPAAFLLNGAELYEVWTIYAAADSLFSGKGRVERKSMRP